MYRVQKILSMIGVLSRRECEKYIKQGLIKINNSIATLGSKVAIDDKITFNQKEYQVTEELINSEIEILVYNKPVGYIVTRRDTAKRKTVFDNLPNINGRWINVGRLDVKTSGLLLFTNNGDIANKLMHPSSNIIRTYEVVINGNFNKSKQNECLSGVKIGLSETGKFSKISQTRYDNGTYKVSLTTGKNREVRRVFQAVNCKVFSLKRIKYSTVHLNNLKEGNYKFLDSTEKNLLLKDLHQ